MLRPKIGQKPRETVAERDEMKRAFDASFEWTRETGDKVASYELASVLKVQGKELCKKMRVWGYGTSKPVRAGRESVQRACVKHDRNCDC